MRGAWKKPLETVVDPKIILFRLEGPQFAVDNVVGYPKHNSSH